MKGERQWRRPIDPRNRGGLDAEGKPLEKRPKFFTSYEAIRIAHGLAMIAGVVCLKDKVPERREVYVQSWRGRFIGGYRKKGAPRQDAKKLTQAMCLSIGWRVADLNASDACGIWGYVKSEIDPSFRYDNGQLAIRLKPGKMRAA